MAPGNCRVGVVLFQLGGPDSPQAIEPFLYNLFCDPDIINFPLARIGRRPLAKLISTTRAKKVQHHYGAIGGFSPIRRLTELQARALEARLTQEGLDARCFVAMRYWHPFTEEAIAALDEAGCEQVVLLPLYPHFSKTTIGSSLNEWNRKFRVAGRQVFCINGFYRDGMYLDSVVEKVNEALARFEDSSQTILVFSAHSVPVSIIEQGDPYQRQIEETVALVLERGRWPNRHRLCYQSKVGASRWLQPTLRSTIRELAAAGAPDVCVVPISFVSDHVETLGEIDHEARELASQLGIRRFEMTAGLNDSPAFIAALAGLVKESLGEDTVGVDRRTHICPFDSAQGKLHQADVGHPRVGPGRNDDAWQMRNQTR
jgi:protoporphyrin/coproporphyrin ferrochelatase